MGILYNAREFSGSGTHAVVLVTQLYVKVYDYEYYYKLRAKKSVKAFLLCGGLNIEGVLYGSI